MCPCSCSCSCQSAMRVHLYLEVNAYRTGHASNFAVAPAGGVCVILYCHVITFWLQTGVQGLIFCSGFNRHLHGMDIGGGGIAVCMACTEPAQAKGQFLSHCRSAAMHSHYLCTLLSIHILLQCTLQPLRSYCKIMAHFSLKYTEYIE
jgi:hypothetical protein